MSQGATIAKKIAAAVKSGSVPPPACAQCGDSRVELHENWAICQRADRSYEDVGNGEVIMGHIGWIPIFIPFPSKDIVEVKEGVDIVCPVPVRVCARRWGSVEGGGRCRWFSGLAQLFFVAAIGLFFAWMFSRSRGLEFSFVWAAASLIVAVVFSAAASALQAKRPLRLKELICRVDDYKELLETFPNAQIQGTEPRALTAEEN